MSETVFSRLGSPDGVLGISRHPDADGEPDRGPPPPLEDRFGHGAADALGDGHALMPRIMTEWAHTITGVDIHPGAAIGRSFFVDHATGVVIGETTHIGNNVKLYQGVTLGALSFPKDERGRVIRGRKRHPTLDDGVTIYANATVLGGNTTIGKESILGASVFVTRAVPAQHAVAHRAPELKVKPTTPDAIANAAEPPNDYQV